MKKIPLGHGQFAVVDDIDYAAASRTAWHLAAPYRNRYAIRTLWNGGNKTTEFLHRFILGLSRGDKREVDHIDGDGLNNTRANLRLTDRHGNGRNRRLSRNNTTGFVGVCRYVYRYRTRWEARIKVNGRSLYLGRHDIALDAALAYNAAAQFHFGEFARLNSVPKARGEA